VHHRVKNNLQLIASIISMQMRETRSGEARQLMQAVQDRVISLATVHKDLYLTSDMTEVRADDLLPEIVQQVITLVAGSGAHIEVETSFSDLTLTPEQAVPLALLLAEVVTHARNEVRGDGGLAHIAVTLDRDGPDRALLVVAHAIEPSALVVPGASMQSGLGRQLIDAFAAQLDGAVRFSEISGHHRMELRFPVDRVPQQPALPIA
jgi:two-component sensor histidine kinase